MTYLMFQAYVLLTLHMLLGLFLIVLILLQRGRGGGLAGSFGGMGGQSAFGTKAGDIFTRVTIVVAVIWILLACACILAVGAATQGKATFVGNGKEPVKTAPAVNQDAEKNNLPANNTAPEDGAAAGDAAGSLNPGKANAPNGDEKNPDGTKDDGAAAAKKPPGAEAKPTAANTDAPADAKEETDQKKPTTPEKTDTKPPE